MKRNSAVVSPGKSRPWQLRAAALSAAVVVSAMSHRHALAVSAVWSGDGGAGDTNWTDAPSTPDTNWVGGVAPGVVAGINGPYTNTDTAQFISTTMSGINFVTPDPNRNVKKIIFGDPTMGAATTTTSFALGVNGGSNNTLYLTGGGAVTVEPNVATTTNDAINNPLDIEGTLYTFDDESDPTVNGGSAGLKFNGSITGSPTSSTTLALQGINYGTTAGQTGNCQLNGNISDGAGGPLNLVMNDSSSNGVWQISGTANTFTGNVTINGGTMRFTVAGAMPSTANVTVGGVTAAVAQLRLGANVAFQTLTVNGGGTIAGSSGSNGITLSGPTTGTGAALTLQFASGTSPVSIGSNPIGLTGTITNGGGVKISGAGGSNTAPITLGGGIDLGTINRAFSIASGSVSNSYDLQINGNVTSDSGGGGITKVGLGILNLQGAANTFTGPLTVSAGTLQASGNLTPSALTVSDVGTATFNQTGGAANVAGVVSVGSAINSNGTYNLSAGSLSAPNSFFIGDAGTGAFNQSGGTVTMTGTTGSVRTGNQAGSSGTYTLSNSAGLTSIYESIGYSGTGIFTQSSGTNTVGNATSGTGIYIGDQPGSTGTYNLSSGTLQINGNEESVGNFGSGTFVQNGGTNIAPGVQDIGEAAGGSGSYTLNSGILNVGTEVVGYLGSGTFTQYGGTNTVSANLHLSEAAGSSGAFTLHGGTLNVNGAFASIGTTTTGTFIQDGGTFNIANALQIAYGPGSSASYNLSAGNVNTGSFQIGISGGGAMTQSGGTVAVTGDLSLGSVEGAGTYGITAGSVRAADLYLAGSNTAAGGSGSFSISQSGSVIVSGAVDLWKTGNQLTLSGGSLSAGSLNTFGDPSRFNWTGGTFTVTGAGGLSLSSSGPIGSSLSLGAGKTLNVTNALVVGPGAQLNLAGGNLSAGGLNTQGDPTQFNWTSGTLKVTGAGGLTLLNSGPIGSSLNLDITKTLNVTNAMFVSDGGQLTLAGGGFSAGSIQVGGNGGATVNQNTGTVNLPGGLSIAPVANTTGTYSLNGATLSASTENIGGSGAGTFTQSGTASNSTGFVDISSSPSGNQPSIYTMNGGTLTISGGASPLLYVGDFDYGTFNQIGGAVVVGGAVYLGRASGGHGTYLLSGGSLSTVDEHIGGFGSGVFTQTAGTNGASGTVTLGASGSPSGSYNLEGGSLTAGALTDYGTFAQTAGTVSVSGATQISGGGIYTLSSNSFSTANLYVGGSASASNGTGAFILNSGVASVTGLSTVWSGGSIAINGGTFQLTGSGASLSSATSIGLGLGGTLQLDNRTSSGGNSTVPAGRLGDSTNIQLNGGTFSYLGADNTASTETLGAAQLISGASTISLVNGTNGTTAVTFSGGLDTSLRQGGATVNFAASNLGSTNQVFLTGQSPGFIAGWATVDDGPGNDANFAKYVSGSGVVPMAAGDYTTDFTSSGHVRITGPTTITLGAPASIATLSLDNRSGSVAINEAGNSIKLNQGGLLSLGTNPGTISGGTLTSGRADGEIDTYVQGSGSLHVNSQIIDNGGTPTSLVKSGPGTMVLGSGPTDTNANTYTGSTYVEGGILELNKAPGSFAISGNSNSKLVIEGGTLLQDQNNQIDPRISLAVVSGNAIFVGSQTMPTLTITDSTASTDPGTVLTIGGVGGGLVPADVTSVLNINSSTARATGSTMIVNGSTTFTGSSPTVQLDAGASGTTAGITGGPALLQLHGDVTAAISSGIGGITSGSVGAGQSPGVLDLGGTTRTFSVSSGTFMISAVVTDGSLNLSGSGKVELMAANTYSGGTTIGGGMLAINSGSSLGASSGMVTFSGGGLQLQSDAANPSFPQPLSASAGTSSTAGGSVSLDIEPILNPTAGTFALSTVTLGSALNVTGSAGGTVTFTSMTLQNLTSGGNASPTAIHNSVNVTINGIINQTGTNGDILKDSAGTLTFGGSSSNTYTGTTMVSGGTLLLDKTSGIAVPGNLTVFGGGTVQLAASNQIATTSVVTLDAVPSAAVLDLHGFNNTFGTGLSFIAGGTLSTGAGAATLGGNVQFTGTSGTGTISGNLALGATGRTFNIARGSAAADMQVTANITGGPTSGAAITKTGPGILSLSGANTYTAGTTVTQGTLQLASQTALPVNSALSIDDGALAAVTKHGMGAKILLQLSSLSFLHNATGRLDLSNNDMIVHNSAVATLAGELKSGFNMGGSYWNGGAGIISTAAAADPTYQTTLAYEAGGVTFDNVSTSSSDVLVKYTDYGDADLNGTVNGADYQQIDKGFGMHLSGWSNGDFNYDGVIDGSDFSLIDNSFNQFMASGANPLAIVSADAISRAVPEPGMMGLLGVGASGLLLRRRRGLI